MHYVVKKPETLEFVDEVSHNDLKPPFEIAALLNGTAAGRIFCESGHFIPGSGEARIGWGQRIRTLPYCSKELLPKYSTLHSDH
jgi:hypothetical protein